MEVSKHLLHYGIAAALVERVRLRRNHKKFEAAALAVTAQAASSAATFVGQRIAKAFDDENEGGCEVHRGAVMEVISPAAAAAKNGGGEDGEEEAGVRFRIRYDDGDAEEATLGDLYEMMNCFEKHGEKKVPTPRAPSSTTAKPSSAARGRPSAAGSSAKKPSVSSPQPWGSASSTTAGSTTKSATKKPTPASSKRSPATNTTPAPTPRSNAKTARGTPGTPSSSGTPAAKKARKEKTPVPEKKSPAVVAKKPVVENVNKLVNDSNPRDFVRQRVAKDFDGETYFGFVTEYDDTEPPPFWHVEYDDGDEEDYSKKDLIKALKYHKKMGKDDVVGNKKKKNGR